MEKEIWKGIKGYEGLYQVSSYGRVKSLERTDTLSNDRKRSRKSKILKPIKDARENKGYLRVELYKDGISKRFAIHRLVAQAFLPNPDNLPQVNHKDEIKTNNRVFLKKDGSVDLKKSNLEWCDGKYNKNYGTRNKRIGEKLSKSVLQLDINTGQVISNYSSTMEAERQLKIFHCDISRCCMGERKTAGGFKWQYADKNAPTSSQTGG